MRQPDAEYRGGPILPHHIRVIRHPDGQQILVRGDFDEGETLRYVNGAWQSTKEREA